MAMSSIELSGQLIQFLCLVEKPCNEKMRLSALLNLVVVNACAPANFLPKCNLACAAIHEPVCGTDGKGLISIGSENRIICESSQNLTL